MEEKEKRNFRERIFTSLMSFFRMNENKCAKLEQMNKLVYKYFSDLFGTRILEASRIVRAKLCESIARPLANDITLINLLLFHCFAEIS